jgi:membrane-associated phospholipid phosphatase
MIGLRRWALSLLGAAIACAVSYQWLDRPIALIFYKTVAHPEPLTKLTHLPDPFAPLAVMTFVGLGLWSLSGRALSRSQKCAFLCSVSLIVADATKAQLKFVFGRTWPDTWVHNNPSFIQDGVYGFNFFHGGPEYASFPSGHMAITCAVVSVLWVYFPPIRTLCALAGLAIGVGLIGASYHFLSDVIAGAFVGISIGWMVTSLWKAHEHFDAR